MSIKRLILLTLLLLSAATIALLLGSNSGPTEPTSPAAEKPSAADKTVSSQPSGAKPAPPPAISRPPAPAIQQPPATPASTEDDEQIEKEQIAAALAQLNNPDTTQRIDGAEQLSAYPTKEVEAALVQALGSDSEAEVRNAAAQSLGSIEKPSEATLNALFAALEDQNEDVRLSAVSTLEDFLLGSDEGSKRYNKIMAGLEAKATARSVPQDTQDAIHDILEDQKNPEQ